jgi:alpha-beta hydrolase superfamily lysophospholipase
VPDKTEERFFDSHDGLRLFCRCWTVEKARGVILLVHGYAEHCGRYRWLAQQLNQRSWSVAAFDYRGHGQSGGRRAHIDRFEDYLADLRTFLREVDGLGTGRPRFLLGHSLGGLIVARLAELEGDAFAGLVLSSPFLGMAIKVPAAKAAMGKLVSGLLPTLTMKTGLDPACLSHDREVVEQYASDPLVSNVTTARWFTEILKAQQTTLAEAARCTRPLLVQQAGADQLSLVADTHAFFQAAGSKDKLYNLYEGFFHEIFNEVERERVLNDLLGWLDQRVPRP